MKYSFRLNGISQSTIRNILATSVNRKPFVDGDNVHHMIVMFLFKLPTRGLKDERSEPARQLKLQR